MNADSCSVSVKRRCFYLVLCTSVVFVITEMMLFEKMSRKAWHVSKVTSIGTKCTPNDTACSPENCAQELRELLGNCLQNNRSSSHSTNIINNIIKQNDTFPSKYMYLAPNEKLKFEKPNCYSLIKGDIQAIKDAILFSTINVFRDKNNYLEETRNCTDFVIKRGYFMNASSEEYDFPIAYSIVMYKDVSRSERLLRAIYRPSNFYCIHVDRKSKPLVKLQMQRIARCFRNVFLSSTSHNVKWGTFSVLQTELTCMRDMTTRTGWKYFINLTGQEFPLKTNLEIVRILKILNGTNNVDANTQGKWKNRWKKAGPSPSNIVPYKGNVHVIVSYGFVNYVLNNPIAIAFTNWLKNTTFPDETFFATLNNNPHLHVPGSRITTGRISTDYTLKPYIARFKNWGIKWGERSFNWTCNGIRIRQICGFGMGDLPLLASRRELFANKFHIHFQPQAYDCLEEWIRNRSVAEYNGNVSMDYSFYRKMPH